MLKRLLLVWFLSSFASEVRAQVDADAGTEAEAEAPVGIVEVVTEAAAGTDPPSEEAAADDPVEVARERLRTAHIGELASRTRAALQASRPVLRASGELTRIERALPHTEEDIARLAHPTRLARIPRLSQRELVDLRADWRRHGNILEGWQEALTARVAELEESRSGMVELRRSWADLRDISVAAGSPDGRHERIVASHAETREAANALDDARDHYTELSDRVSELQIVVEDVADRLRDAAGAYRERLGVRDAPPLYSGLSAADADDESIIAQARESFVERAEAPVELLRELLPVAVGLTVFFCMVLGLLLVLARAPRSMPEPRASDPDAPRTSEPAGLFAREVLKRPVASSLLLTLLASTLAIEHAPIIVYDLIFFVTLPPLWRAVPPLTGPTVRPLVRGAIVFLALDRVQAMLPEGTAFLRVVLLVEALLSAVALVLWLRESRGGAAPVSVRIMSGLAALVMVLGLVANLLGYVFLATVLARGTGYSAYAALSLAGAVIVIEAILDLVVVSPVGQRLRSLREHAATVHARTLRILTAVSFLAWLAGTLEGFGLWGPFSTWAEEVLTEHHSVGSLEISIGAVLGATLILVFTWMLLRFVRFVLELDVLPRFRLEPGVDGAISGLTRYVVGGTGLLLALAFLGIDASQIALVAGALGVGIGFGLQGIVANFIAGIVLMLERPVRLGDFVEVGPLVGIVDRIGLRSSTVRAMDGAEVIVPNESLISREVINWTLSDRKRRVAIKVGVAYGADPHHVLEVLRGVAQAHKDVIQIDRARVLFDGFGDSSLDFTVQFWAGSFEDSIRLKSEVGIAMFDALSAANIEIPFPQREVRVISMPKPEAEAEAAEDEPAASQPAATEAGTGEAGTGVAGAADGD